MLEASPVAIVQDSASLTRRREGFNVVTTFADLEARVRGLESRAQRAEEDITAIIGTVIETRDDVKWLKRAVQALLDHDGVGIDGAAGA
jgi:uncharacterized coiled-coil protein SlyX